ncbi:hypothetical protein COV88_01850 [Candidatus Saccharibacteria bacterium CG11_big_fil_rev_8_21_14_0_20_41_19]|nr:site-2 protease family protein [Candidatus Saccharibacteria bacterium]OIP85750.1 MAG: hypothetical protein AUK57_02760 [Candidatus Saccharibacteria bacterium CG2_30_41_52]PIQ70866.1 MAG: hypothetical protein COV88_01850 [Candidatus Saccharibacteria bacterium CG11_big_fil_rev_8_21_14_0_20_41_19]PIZ61219.1 MAG: hypothetical protein COY18_00355 [Candidatus Saccharibacteria bacterium CG_4_10_14_0_2_um_filter_41_11]PJC29655.1 MAG: hypothetical protein CO052_02090 [Candidatus Saccharibacteria bact
MELLFGVITGLIILVFLVVAHELGHAIVAIRNGVVVEEFGIGFPPLVWKKKLKNKILFTVNWLPLGGYVKLQGENDAADKKGDYGAVSFFKKTKILLAGVLMNWLIAAILLTGLALTGLPKVLPDQVMVSNDTTVISSPVEVASLTKDFPAEKAGLRVGDKILKFNGQDVSSAYELIQLAKQNLGKTVTVIYSSGGIEKTVKITLGQSSAGGILGAGLGQRDVMKSTWSAPIVGVATAAQFTVVTIQGVGNLIGNLVSGLVLQLSSNPDTRNQASEDLKTVNDSVAGPIGILGTIFPAAQQAGFNQLVFLTAIISLSLAVMNILPIPALDGGRWFTMVIFRLLKKDLNKEREEKIQAIGFSILMGLTVLVTITDVAKLF